MQALLTLLLCGTHQWTLLCGGDIMLNGLKPSKSHLEAVAPIIRSADISLANLEVPLTNTRKRTVCKSDQEVKAKTQFVLKADPKHAEFLPAWGFKVLTQGNNHAMDYRSDGLSQMLSLLDKQLILHTGAGKDREGAWKPAVYPLENGIQVSIAAALAFAGSANAAKCTPATEDSAGVATLCFDGPIDKTAKKRLVNLVAALRSQGGPVILNLHWGTERAAVPREYQVELGRACIDAGADAVIGAHPHVLQGAELYRGKPILYSMGNLVAWSSGGTGLAELKFDGRRFAGFVYHPFKNEAGTAKLYKYKESLEARKYYKGLSLAIQAKYPSKDSKPLY